MFARLGIPKMIFSDNGTQFTSEEFKQFCKINGIMHRTSAPYHPATNGLAENAVASFKRNFSKELNDKKNSSISINTILQRYLFNVRRAPHCSTGVSPSSLMLRRELRTRLNLLHQNKQSEIAIRQTENFKGNRTINLKVGDKV